MLSGYLTSYPPLQLAVLRTAIWLPLLFWLWLRVFTRPGRAWRYTILAALAYVTAFLAGHPQTFLHLTYALGAWILFLLMRVALQQHDRGPGAWGPNAGGPNAGGPVAERLRQILVFGLLSLGLSMAQLWPSLEFTRYSIRAAVDYGYVSGGFSLRQTWQMLFPGALTTWSPLYVGIVPLGLGLLAVLSAAPALFRRGAPGPHAYVAFFPALTLAALLVSYGGNAFLYPLVYRVLPGWNLFRGQERAAYLVAFGLSVLAGLGAAAGSSRPPPGAQAEPKPRVRARWRRAPFRAATASAAAELVRGWRRPRPGCILPWSWRVFRGWGFPPPRSGR